MFLSATRACRICTKVFAIIPIIPFQMFQRVHCIPYMCFDLDTEKEFRQSRQATHAVNIRCVFAQKAVSHAGVLSEGVQIITNLILGQI